MKDSAEELISYFPQENPAKAELLKLSKNPGDNSLIK